MHSSNFPIDIFFRLSMPLLLSIVSFTVNSNTISNDIKNEQNTPKVLPKSYEAEYQIKSSKYKISVSAKRNFSINETKASITQKASLFMASISQESQFLFYNNSCSVKSQIYDYQHSVLGKKKKYKLSFDYEKNNFIEKKDGNETISPISDNFYDELSYQEALRCELINNKELKIGNTFSYQVRTKGKTKLYQFNIVAFETLKTKLGELETVKLERIRSSKKGDEHSNIWFAQEYGYLLVKFIQRDDDDTYSLDIQKLNR